MSEHTLEFDQSQPTSKRRLNVVVVSHAYNGPGRMGPFSALGQHVNLTLVGPAEHGNGTLTSTAAPASSGIRVVPLKAQYLGRSQFFLRRLKKTLNACSPDIVCVEYDPWHVQFLQTIVALKLARSRARVIPIVKKNTYRASTSILGRSKRYLSRWGLQGAHRIIAASSMTRAMYIRDLGVPESKVVVQPHLAVDTERFHPSGRSPGQRPMRVGFVGKIGPTKGVPELLTAFDDARRRTGVSAELCLVGEVVDTALQAAIASTESVQHLGAIGNEDLQHFLSSIDVFAMPARILPDHQEHDGRAVLEAMAVGLPCVVSSSGILPELVSDSEGRVFPAGDVPGLANCLAELMESVELRTELGACARERALATVSPAVLSAQRIALFNTIMEVPA
jgi:glycosyltransferase involved in cell wall biosynthesis